MILNINLRTWKSCMVLHTNIFDNIMKETLKDKINCEGNYFDITDEGNYRDIYVIEDIRKLYNLFT